MHVFRILDPIISLNMPFIHLNVYFLDMVYLTKDIDAFILPTEFMLLRVSRLTNNAFHSPPILLPLLLLPNQIIFHQFSLAFWFIPQQSISGPLPNSIAIVCSTSNVLGI